MDVCLKSILSPRSIAVIGASKKPGTIGNQVLKNLIDGGFTGDLYPVNPTANEILARKCYPSIKAVPGQVDVAVFCVPANLVLGVARECAEKKVKGYVVITSGFAEVGNVKDEQELVKIARAAGGRVIGPNIVGILVNSARANASFAPRLPYPGHTALLSQSGALLIALDQETFVRHLGVESMISLGNMADVDFADCIRYYDDDPATSAIALYVEGIKNGRAFIEAGRRCRKPIIAIKAGVSAHGAAAAASHTGSLAGSVKVYDAAFQQAHVIKADNLEELLSCSQALSMQPEMPGENIILVTNGGGIGVLGSDGAEAAGVPLRAAPADLQEVFRKHMPDFGSPKNPVDITGGAGAAGYEGAIEAALRHPWTHAVAVFYCETAVTKPLEIAESAIAAIHRSGVKSKPVVACFVGGEECEKAGARLLQAGIPMYSDPACAMKALAALRQVARFKEKRHDGDFEPYADVDRSRARAVIDAARRAGRTALTEPEAKELFLAYKLAVAPSKLAKTPDGAVAAAREMGFPVVLKIVSPDILHKSDAGGVKVNLKDEAAVRQAYAAIVANAKKYKADADIHGILVQQMAPTGREVIVGSVNDPQFGPTVMFGLGGIFVEALKDVTFRVAPCSPATALEMFTEIRSYPILQGTRGEKRLDQEKLAETVSRLSQLVSDLGDDIAETDANPIMLYEQGRGLRVVDARVILKKK